MKKRNLSLFFSCVLIFICSIFFVACGNGNATPGITEYYEIEYQDGTGTHIAKAIQILLVEDIKIYKPTQIDSFIVYNEWEYNDILDLCFAKTADTALGWFYSSSSQNFGSVSLYYGEHFQNEPYGNWLNMRYFVRDCSATVGGFLDAVGKNIVIDSQIITRFNITSNINDITEFQIDAMSENNLVKTDNVRIGINFDYDNTTWQKIILEEDGDFTSIKINGETIDTIRTENILRKVKV